MHVALIVDGPRLRHEQSMINRITTGLLAEGIEVAHVVPDTFDRTAIDIRQPPLIAEAPIPVAMRVVPWMRRQRRDALVEALGRTPPDLVYAIGKSGWWLGLDLGGTLERPVALDVWCAGQVRAVPRGRAAERVAAYIAATEPIAEALRGRVDASLVCTVRFGVPAPAEPRIILSEPERAIALAILGGARDVPSYKAMLGGLSRTIRDFPQTQAFIELAGPHEHEIWQEARKLDLLGHISGLTDATQHHALFARCDVLLLPERYGEVRSVVLEAMAAGMPVIAADDPSLEMDREGEGTLIVKQPDAEGWAHGMDRLMRDVTEARGHGLAARNQILAHHRPEQQVRGLIETFERILTGGAIPFHGATG